MREPFKLRRNVRAWLAGVATVFLKGILCLGLLCGMELNFVKGLACLFESVRYLISVFVSMF